MSVWKHRRLRGSSLDPKSISGYMRKQCMCFHTDGLRRVSPHDPICQIVRMASQFGKFKNCCALFVKRSAAKIFKFGSSMCLLIWCVVQFQMRFAISILHFVNFNFAFQFQCTYLKLPLRSEFNGT